MYFFALCANKKDGFFLQNIMFDSFHSIHYKNNYLISGTSRLLLCICFIRDRHTRTQTKSLVEIWLESKHFVYNKKFLSDGYCFARK